MEPRGNRRSMSIGSVDYDKFKENLDEGIPKVEVMGEPKTNIGSLNNQLKIEEERKGSLISDEESKGITAKEMKEIEGLISLKKDYFLGSKIQLGCSVQEFFDNVLTFNAPQSQTAYWKEMGE